MNSNRLIRLLGILGENLYTPTHAHTHTYIIFFLEYVITLWNVKIWKKKFYFFAIIITYLAGICLVIFLNLWVSYFIAYVTTALTLNLVCFICSFWRRASPIGVISITIRHKCTTLSSIFKRVKWLKTLIFYKNLSICCCACFFQ